MAILSWVGVPGTAEQWDAMGFAVAGGVFRIRTVTFEVGYEAMAWGFDGAPGDLNRLGVPTRTVPRDDAAPDSHPNGIDIVDHVVYAVPDLDETIATFDEVLGLQPRRRARPRGPQGPEMAFYRAGDAVLEVVGAGSARSGAREGESRRGPAFGGVAFRCPDLDAAVATMKHREVPVGEPHDAVQGGRIASVWRGYTGMPIAIMQPPPKG